MLQACNKAIDKQRNTYIDKPITIYRYEDLSPQGSISSQRTRPFAIVNFKGISHL